jgi:hypothetical protein
LRVKASGIERGFAAFEGDRGEAAAEERQEARIAEDREALAAGGEIGEERGEKRFVTNALLAPEKEAAGRALPERQIICGAMGDVILGAAAGLEKRPCGGEIEFLQFERAEVGAGAAVIGIGCEGLFVERFGLGGVALLVEERGEIGQR